MVIDGGGPKGDVLGVAELAGVMAAKRTSELIPLCHPLPLTSVEVSFGFDGDCVLRVEATARVFGRTGVEMEALTGVHVAALTVHDMCKAMSPAIVVENIHLTKKTGGKTDYEA